MQAMRTRGDCKSFLQGAHGNLTWATVQVIDTTATGIEGVDHKVTLIDNLKAPRLSVVPAGRPPGEFEDISDGVGNLLHLYSKFALGKSKG
jgi:hypothetical protein